MIFKYIKYSKHAGRRLEERGIESPSGKRLYNLKRADKKTIMKKCGVLDRHLLYKRRRQDGRTVIYIIKPIQGKNPLLITAYFLDPPTTFVK